MVSFLQLIHKKAKFLGDTLLEKGYPPNPLPKTFGFLGQWEAAQVYTNELQG
jgi:hypothetical protein